MTAIRVAIEQFYEKPFRELFIDLYLQHGTINRVCQVLGISRNSAWAWRLETGLSESDLKLAVLKHHHASGGQVTERRSRLNRLFSRGTSAQKQNE